MSAVRKVKQRNWSLDRFAQSVQAQAKKRGLKPPAKQALVKPYEGNMSVRATVLLFEKPAKKSK